MQRWSSADHGPLLSEKKITKQRTLIIFPFHPLQIYPPYFAAESGWGEIVAKQSKHQQEAWDFVKFMAEDEQAKYFNVATVSVPANKNVAEDPSFRRRSSHDESFVGCLAIWSIYGDGIDTNYFKKQVKIDNFQLIASDKLSVEEGLAKIEEAVNKMIDKNE